MHRAISWPEVRRRTAAISVYWGFVIGVLLIQDYSALNARGAWKSWVEDGAPTLLWFLPWMPLSAVLLFGAVRLRLSEYRPIRTLLLLATVVAVVVQARLVLQLFLNASSLSPYVTEPVAWSTFGRLCASLFHREFLNGCFVTACFAAHEMYRAGVERSKTSALLQARLSEAELRHLRAQLHPHFLFNALNAVTTLIRKDPAAAEKSVGDLSELLRRALDDSEGQMVTVAREMEFLERYLAIQHVRFGDRLRTRIDVDPNVLSARIPSMILQPLVENAVRHSIASREGGSISVVAQGRDADVILRIVDDGQGLGAEETRVAGLGLPNVRSRLEHLFGGRAEVRILNVPGAFTVELRLPRECE